jgi:orotate phosphoribosyltransferase
MDTKRAFELLEKSGALLNGHFVLTSGKHSERYIQCALLLSRPDLAIEFNRDIADNYKDRNIDVVAAPAVGGIVVSYEVGRLLGRKAVFLERENGLMTLRRGFEIQEGDNVLIVEDVITTGSSVFEVGEVIKKAGGHVAGYSSIVNRSSGRFKPDEPYYFCVQMDIPVYEPDVCPLCQKGIQFVKPGSKGLK